MIDLPWRIEKKIAYEPMTGCWLWTGGKHTNGYGMTSRYGKTLLIHRFVYEWLKGRIPDGLQIDHLCRVRWCVNPDHLEPVTLQENICRGEVGAEHASRSTCPQGHPYDEQNTTIRKQYRGGGVHRTCRECNRLRCRERYQRNPEKYRAMKRAEYYRRIAALEDKSSNNGGP